MRLPALPRPPIRLTAATLVLAALAGCSTVADPTTLAAAPDGGATLGRALSPDRALAALPPEAGAVVSVVEQRKGDGEVKQTITLAADPGARGDDRIEVISHEKTPLKKPRRLDAETIEEEMAEALPGVAMSISPRVVTAATGPIGVATGKTTDGVGCLYAWSNAEDRAASGRTTEFFGLRVSSATKSELEVRVRLCRRGWSEDRLVALAEGLRIGNASAATDARPMAGYGSDALSSAGYGNTGPVVTGTARAPSVAPTLAPAAAPIAAPVRAAAVRPAPVRTAATAAPVRKTAPQPPAATAPTAAAPTTVASPIPLPSGG